jgi:hypothetical protein
MELRVVNMPELGRTENNHLVIRAQNYGMKRWISERDTVEENAVELEKEMKEKYPEEYDRLIEKRETDRLNALRSQEDYERTHQREHEGEDEDGSENESFSLLADDVELEMSPLLGGMRQRKKVRMEPKSKGTT